MKTFIATLLSFISISCFAMNDNDVFVSNLEPDGKILLFSGTCPLPGSKDARISLIVTENNVIPGCWFLYEESVYAVWLPPGIDPVKSKYDPENFELEKLL